MLVTSFFYVNGNLRKDTRLNERAINYRVISFIRTIPILTLLFIGKECFAQDIDVMPTLPKTCSSITMQSLTFGLDLLSLKRTTQLKNKIKEILEEAQSQTCIVKMQYDGLMSKFTATILESVNLNENIIDSFQENLLQIINDDNAIKFKTLRNLRQVFSVQEWNLIIADYYRYIKVEQAYFLERARIGNSYDELGITDTLVSQLSEHRDLFIALNNVKSPLNNMIQIASNQFLSFKQIGVVNQILRAEMRKELSFIKAQQDSSVTLLKLLSEEDKGGKKKALEQIFNQQVLIEYNRNFSLSKTLVAIIQILTPEQKKQAQEKYMMLRGLQ